LRSTKANIFFFVAAVVDLFLFAFLISISNYLFGTWSRGLHGGPMLAFVYAAVVIACLVAPVAGVVFQRRGKTAVGLLVAYLPVAGVAVILMFPGAY
jgi:hypothetical protein